MECRACEELGGMKICDLLELGSACSRLEHGEVEGRLVEEARELARRLSRVLEEYIGSRGEARSLLELARRHGLDLDALTRIVEGPLLSALISCFEACEGGGR